jgi:hypothetical protein
MRRAAAAGLVLVAAAGAARWAAGQAAPAAVAETEAGTAPAALAVPAGRCVAVVTDGLFTAGEWDDAARVAVAEGVTLLVKEQGGVVFIGLRGEVQAGIGPSEVFLAAAGGPIHRLHVSAQLGETVLPATGEAPPYRFGLTTGWYANELRRDEALAGTLMKEGRPPIEKLMATYFPSEGIELAVRREKVAGKVWLLRLAASAMSGGRPGMVVWPAGTAERATDGWLELRLP